MNTNNSPSVFWHHSIAMRFTFYTSDTTPPNVRPKTCLTPGEFAAPAQVGDGKAGEVCHAMAASVVVSNVAIFQSNQLSQTEPIFRNVQPKPASIPWPIAMFDWRTTGATFCYEDGMSIMYRMARIDIG